MKTDSFERLQSAKCANVLFSLCVVMAVATWLLNRSIAENRTLRQTEMARYNSAEEMLGKFKAYQLKSASFFDDLTWCAISPIESCVEVYHSLDGGSAGMYLQPRYGPEEFSDYFFQGAVRQFASNAAVIVSAGRTPDQRFDQLKIALTNAFTKTNIQRAANAFIFGGSDFSPGLNTNILWHMSRIEDRVEWGGIARWLALSEWPPRGGGSGYNDGSGAISYTDRFPGKWNSYNEEWHNYNLLLVAGPSQAESILVANWTRKREVLMSPSSPP